MGTITTASVIGKAHKILQDATGVRWDPTEMLGWLNSGQRALVLLKTNAYVKAQVVTLVTGTRQSLPDDAVQLLDIPRNMAADGTTPGRAIRQTERETLDATLPTWHSAPASAVVKHYMFNLLDPKAFYVYPPQPAVNPGKVEMIFGALPPDATTTITVDDIYETVLIDYMLYRAFSKDSEYADVVKADKHYAAFETGVTGKARMEVGTNPAARAPANTTNLQAPTA